MGKITKRNDGYYCGTVVAKNGKRKYIYGSSPAEVRFKISAVEAEEDRGKPFNKVADEWYADARERISVQTYRGYRIARDRAVKFFGKQPISDITTHDVQRWIGSLMELSLSAKTISNHKMCLSAIFESALVSGEIESNPVRNARIPKGLPKEKRLPASSEDEKKILAAGGDCLLYFTALLTGLRKGELLALQWCDVDFEKNEISVTKSVAFESIQPIIKLPKTDAGIRRVPLLPALRDVLEPLAAEADPEYYIFSKNGTKPMRHDEYARLEKKIQSQFGISCTLHQLRHTFASIAVGAGIPEKTLQQIMGHAQISTTMDVYAAFRSENLKQAAEMLNTTVLGKSK